MDDLTAFVRARIDEDEAFAEQFLEGLLDEYVGDLTPVQVFAMRVLREVAAKRAIMAEHRPQAPSRYGNDVPRCLVCLTRRYGYQEDWQPDPWPCQTLQRIAAVWSGHPDYRQEWAH